MNNFLGNILYSAYLCINKTPFVNLHPKNSFLIEKNGEWIFSECQEELPIDYTFKLARPIWLSKNKFDEISALKCIKLNYLKKGNLYRQLAECYEVNAKDNYFWQIIF